MLEAPIEPAPAALGANVPGRSSLFDLDAPSAASHRPVAASSSRPNQPQRSTMEFLYDLDDPSMTMSREIDLDADPTLREAVAAAAAEADALDAAASEAAAEAQIEQATQAAEDDRPERLVSLPIPEQARGAEEQLQQRRVRVMDRIATVRDAFRFLGHMGIPEEQRKGVARMLLELETAAASSEAANVVKDPRAALAAAGKAQLDAAERSLGPIEDKLLALDDQVGDSIFEDRVLNTKQNKKIIARYGRLLASRRMPPGPRRNRFEWLAMQLLTRRTEHGELAPLPPDRARNVLQHLIGGLPRKVRQPEVDEATDYLHDVAKRLDDLRSADQLFDSGLFADLHGYKVSMREHLTSPEFVYRSVLTEAKLQNRLEQWIAAQERLHDKNQLTAEGTPRVHMRRRLAAERDDVDGRLGAKARLVVGPVSDEPPPPPPKRARPAQPTAPGALSSLLARIRVDRSLLLAAAAAIVIVGSSLFVGESLGVVGEPAVRRLTKEELPALSPLLVGGLLRGTGETQHLQGWISGKRWRALDGRKKHEAADAAARKLSAAGIKEADLYDGSTLIVVIKSGTLVSAQGAKL